MVYFQTLGNSQSIGEKSNTADTFIIQLTLINEYFKLCFNWDCASLVPNIVSICPALAVRVFSTPVVLSHSSFLCVPSGIGQVDTFYNKWTVYNPTNMHNLAISNLMHGRTDRRTNWQTGGIRSGLFWLKINILPRRGIEPTLVSC